MYDNSFMAPIAHLSFETYAYTVVYLPDDVISALPTDLYPRPRVEGEMNEHSFEAACMPTAEGQYYLMVSKAMMKRIGAEFGDEIEVRFSLADQDAVNVPDEILHALSQDEQADQVWESLTPGRQRGLSYMVASAKREQTRQKRAAKLIEGLNSGEVVLDRYFRF